MNGLEWSGHADFSSKELAPWKVKHPNATDTSGIAVAGATKSAKGLTFAKVDGAGHMVPYDKPVEAEAMLLAWLEGEL